MKIEINSNKGKASFEVPDEEVKKTGEKNCRISTKEVRA